MPIRKNIRTDELKLIPTVVAVTATGSLTSTKPRQSNAVKNVLPTRDNFLPSPGLSINHAPNFIIIINHRQKGENFRSSAKKNKTGYKRVRTTAPGHPPMVKMTTSQRVLSSEAISATLITRRVSSSFGRYTLNMVNASIIPHHAPHTSTVVRRHSGSRP